MFSVLVCEVCFDGEGGFVVWYGSDDELLVDVVVFVVLVWVVFVLFGDFVFVVVMVL